MSIIRSIILASPLLILGCGGGSSSSDTSSKSDPESNPSNPSTPSGISFAYTQQAGVCIATSTSNNQEQNALRTAGFTETNCDKSTYLSSCEVDTFEGQTISNPFIIYYEFNAESPKSAASQAKDYESACTLNEGIYQRGPYTSPDLPVASDPVVAAPNSTNYQSYYFDTDTLFNNQVFHIEDQKYYEIANPGDSVELITKTSEYNHADHLLALFEIKRANNEVELVQFNAGTGELIEFEGVELNHLSCFNRTRTDRLGNLQYTAFVIWQKIDQTRGCDYEYDIDTSAEQHVGILEDKATLRVSNTAHAYTIAKENNLLAFSNGEVSGLFDSNSQYFDINDTAPQSYHSGVNSKVEAQINDYFLVVDYNRDVYWANLNDLKSGNVDSLTSSFTFSGNPEDLELLDLNGKTYLKATDTPSGSIDEHYLFEFDSNANSLVQRVRIRAYADFSWVDTDQHYIAMAMDPGYHRTSFSGYFFDKATWEVNEEASFTQPETESYHIYDAGERVLVKTNARYHFISDDGIETRDTATIDSDELYILTNPHEHPRLGDPSGSFYSMTADNQAEVISKIDFESATTIGETPIATFNESIQNVRNDSFWIGQGFETTTGKWFIKEKYYGDPTSGTINEF